MPVGYDEPETANAFKCSLECGRWASYEDDPYHKRYDETRTCFCGQSELTTALETSLQLSLIYKRLLNNLKQCRRRDEQVAAMALVNEAFNEAVRYLSVRCPTCDSADFMCGTCGRRTPNA